MTEPLLPATVRLTSAAEALAALAAHVRIQSEGLIVDDRLSTLLAAIAKELTGSDQLSETDPTAQAVGMARALLRECVNLVEDPARSGDWNHVDESILQGLGRLSMAIAPVFAIAASQLDGLAGALAAPTATFLDVGTGTGWLAIATARAFPAASVVGIDILEPALRLARRNVTAEQLDHRITLRQLDVTALADTGTYDAIWLPLPFLPKDVVASAVERARDALRPGGWLLPGTFAGPDDHLSRLLVDVRIVRSGGHPWTDDDLLDLLGRAGLCDPHELPRSWPAPVRLFAAQRKR